MILMRYEKEKAYLRSSKSARKYLKTIGGARGMHETEDKLSLITISGNILTGSSPWGWPRRVLLPSDKKEFSTIVNAEYIFVIRSLDLNDVLLVFAQEVKEFLVARNAIGPI